MGFRLVERDKEEVDGWDLDRWRERKKREMDGILIGGDRKKREMGRI